MKFSSLAAADAELSEAVQHYNQQRAGLGDKFLIELLAVLERIRRFPSACPQLHPNPVVPLAPIPLWGVVSREGEILVVAVADVHRRPLYWKERVGEWPADLPMLRRRVEAVLQEFGTLEK